MAAVVRVFAWRAQPFITVDGTEYVRYAEALMAGGSIATIHAPGYPLLIAAALAVLHDRVMSGALVSFLCGSLLPWPVWALARGRLGDARAALPALLVALHPELARYSAVVMSESAYLLALFGGLALVGRSAPAAGAVMGAAYVIRAEALAAAAVLALRGAWRLRRGRTTVRHTLLGVAGFLALALPCLAWYHSTTGQWTLSPKLAGVGAFATDWRTVEPRLPADEAPPPPPPLSRRLADAVRNPGAIALPYARWLLGLWPVPLLLLSLAGLRMRIGLEAVAFIQIPALAVLSFGVPRYLLVYLPALAILAALPAGRARSDFGMEATPAEHGHGSLARGAARRTARRPGRVLAIGMAALALAGVALSWAWGAREFSRPYDGHIEAHVDAGRWLRAQSAPGEPVLDRKPYVAFYAERPYVFIPEAPYDSLIQWAVRTRARWLVVDQGVAEVFRHELKPLLYDAEFREREQRLELVYVGGRVIGYGVGIFRVLQPGEARTGQPPAIEASWLRGP